MWSVISVDIYYSTPAIQRFQLNIIFPPTAEKKQLKLIFSQSQDKDQMAEMMDKKN